MRCCAATSNEANLAEPIHFALVSSNTENVFNPIFKYI